MQSKVLVLDVDPSTTIIDLKERIREMEGIPVELQRLVFAGKQLMDGKTLSESNVQHEATVFLVKMMVAGKLMPSVADHGSLLPTICFFLLERVRRLNSL